MRIIFFIQGKPHHFSGVTHVPREGERVTLDGEFHRVTLVEHNIDEGEIHIHTIILT